MICRCPLYSPHSRKILIVQLSCPAAVIRSSALIARLKDDDPNCYICYLTSRPELLPHSVDEPLAPDGPGIFRLQMDTFDTLYNLDLDRRAAAVTNLVNATTKKGFYLRQGNATPLDHNAHSSYLSALFPDSCRDDLDDPVRRMFNLCDLEYRRELPRLDPPSTPPLWPPYDAIVLGLHTVGQADQPNKHYWQPRQWGQFIEILNEHALQPILLGDRQADRFNRNIANIHQSAQYPGPLTWNDMITALNHCDLVLGAASPIIELALALGKQVIWLRDDHTCQTVSDLRGRGAVVHPNDSRPGQTHLHAITPQQLLDAVLNRLNHLETRPDQDRNVPPAPCPGTAEPSVAAVRTQVSRTRQPP